MLSEIFVGTLATLNALVSPFTPAPHQTVYKYSLEGQKNLRPQCILRGEPLRSNLLLSLDVPVEGRFFQAQIKSGVCVSQNNYRKLELILNLPKELLTISALLKLPVGQAYVVHQVPAANSAESNYRVRLVRSAIEGNTLPVEVSWIPEEGKPPAHRPIKIFIALDEKDLENVSVSAADGNKFKWKRISLEVKHPLATDLIQLEGNLSQISAHRLN